MENRAVDALSRKVSGNDGELIAVSTCIPAWLAELATVYKEDVQNSRLLTELSMGNAQHPKFQLKDGILRYDGRIWTGSNITLQHKNYAINAF